MLRLTLVNFAAGGTGNELSFLAERTEGDAMRLRCRGPGVGGGGWRWWGSGVYVCESARGGVGGGGAV